MNAVTKIFIVINLILACFAAYLVPVVYTYNENFKRRWDRDTLELSEDVRRLTTRLAEVSFDRSVTEVNHRVLAAENASLQQQIDAKNGELLQRQSELATQQATINTLTVQIQSQRETNQQLSQSLERERKTSKELNHIAQVARAVAFQLNVKLAEVEDDLNNAKAELTRRERVIFDLEQDAKRKDAQLAIIRDRHPRAFADATSEQITTDAVIRGIVAAVRLDPQGRQDLVMLTVGAEEAVREGMEFILYRGNQYVVKVRAERVLGDMVACRVMPDTWNTRGEQIRQGDSAQNRLF